MEQIAEPNVRYSEDEYFALETAKKDVKHEYFDGKIFAMAGAELTHNVICANLIRELSNEFIKKKKKCRVLTSDQRVGAKIKTSGASGYFYPDVVVVCGEPELDERSPRTLLNPTIVVEVLSKSNSGQEVMEKLKFYREIKSMTDVLLVDSESISATQFEKTKEGEWIARSFGTLDEKVILKSRDIELALADIYRDADVKQAS